MTIKVTHFSRKPAKSMFSIERLFKTLSCSMPPTVTVSRVEVPFVSQGILNRLFNIIYVRLKRSEVNHIVGDIHYVNLLLPRRRTVLTIHDCVSVNRMRGIKKWIFIKLWYSLPIARSAVVTVISESTKNQILELVACREDKIKVVKNCIVGGFYFTPKEFNEVSPTLLHVGTGVNKNLERHIEAIQGINCKLIIVGNLSHDQREILDKYDINFENFVDLSDAQLVEIYIKSDILLFCSTYEGFGLPILEANAVGRPVVTSNVYSMPEVAGDAAFIADPYDVGSIRNGILKIINDRTYRELLIQNGLINASKFNPKVVAREYAAIYEDIVKRSSI